MKNVVSCFVVMVTIVSLIEAQSAEKQAEYEIFRKQHPGKMIAEWDSTSGGPKKIIGNNIFVKSQSVNLSNIQDMTRQFISDNQDLLNINGSDLRLDRITELNNKFYISFLQYYNDIPIWKTKLRLIVTPNGKIISINSPCFSNLKTSAVPSISKNQAITISSSYMSKNNDSDKDSVLSELVFYPLCENKVILCWHIKTGREGILINAQSGEKVYKYSLIKNDTMHGIVLSKTWSISGASGATPDLTDYCQDLRVIVQGVGNCTTNSSGYYEITVPTSGDYSINSTLYGPNCYVTNFTGSNASYSGTANTSGDYNWTWQESDHYNEYFVFDYMNKAWHNFYNGVSGFSGNYWYSNRMLGKADAALAASIFHFGEIPIPTLKQYLKSNGIEVRI